MERNSYIVRVYNQSSVSFFENKAESMIGIVEDVDTGQQYTFHNKDELWGVVLKHQEKITE